MENNTLISVIMPVYNVKKYLRKSIDSVLNQTFKNFELIIIDDGSSDGSSSICDEYSMNDNRISVYHVENGGVAEARNIGIKHSKGKYIYFIDSDDYIDPDMLMRLYDNMKKYNAEIIISGFFMEYLVNEEIVRYKVNTSFIEYSELKEFVKEAYKYIKINLINTPWNKLYLSSIIKNRNVHFQKRFGEDVYFNIDYLKNVNKIVFIDDALYFWNRTREGSETDKIYKDPQKFLVEKYSVFKKILELYEEVNLDTECYQKNIYNYFVSRLVQFIEETVSYKNISVNEKFTIIKTMYKNEEYKNIIGIVKADSTMMKVCYIPLKLKSVFLSFIMGFCIGIVKRRFKKIFYNIRAKQINNSKAGGKNEENF